MAQYQQTVFPLPQNLVSQWYDGDEEASAYTVTPIVQSSTGISSIDGWYATNSTARTYRVTVPASAYTNGWTQARVRVCSNAEVTYANVNYAYYSQFAVIATGTAPPVYVETDEDRAAKERAKALLRSHLTDAQLGTLDAHDHFEVRGSAGRRYRIHARSAMGNVEELDDVGIPLAHWCAHPVGVPVADAILAQKLILETDEDHFREVANEQWRRAA